MPAKPPSVLEWYRVDQTRRIRSALVIGTTVLTLGACIMAGAFLAHAAEGTRKLAAIVGLLCTVTGALYAVIGMALVLRTDAYLAVQVEGIRLELEDGEAFLPWDELERVHFDAAKGAIVFLRRSGDEVVTRTAFAGTERKALATRLDTLRRRADFHMLKAGF